jgi:membrane AbrB-like protein
LINRAVDNPRIEQNAIRKPPMLWRSSLSRPTPFSLDTLRPLLQWLLLIVLAGSAGQLFRYLHVPAALFLGPMLVAIGFGVSGASIRLNKHVFRLGQGSVGLLVAHSMTMGVLLTAMHAWHVMVFATLLTIALSAVVGIGLARWGGIQGSTAAWGTSPGAASAMVAMSEDDGADSRVVATMQYVRVVCVVMVGALVSRVIGADVGGTDAHSASALLQGIDVLSLGLTVLTIVVGVTLGARVPAGALLVPLLLGGALQLSGLLQITMPTWLLAIAYGAIGSYIGLRFDRVTIHYVWRRLPAMIIGALLLILLCAMSAWVIAEMMGKDFLSVYLATSPGGLDAMAIIAIDTHSDVGFVLAMQTLRLFGVIVTGAYIARQVIRVTQRLA